MFTMSLTDASPFEIAKSASNASRELAGLSADDRNGGLSAIYEALSQGKDDILQANARDLEACTKLAADGCLSQTILKRLDLGRLGKYDEMLKGILDVRGLEDPGR